MTGWRGVAARLAGRPENDRTERGKGSALRSHQHGLLTYGSRTVLMTWMTPLDW